MKSFLSRWVAPLVASLALAGPAVAQNAYPDKPIRLVVPYAPGGSTSVLAQTLATLLGKSLGQSVFVDHRAGANTVIGTGAVAKAAPDGYTLMLTASSHVVVPLLTSTPYDPFKDFTPVGTVAKTEFMLVVHPALPVQGLNDFVAMARAKAGEVTYASAGNGSGTHLVAEQFAQAAGVKLTHVPYKGSGPLINDLVGGQVQASFQTPAVAMPFIQSKRLRALAVSGNERLAGLPDVPTLAELGIRNFNATNWFGVVAPAGIPREVSAKIANALTSVSAEPEFQEKLASLGLQPFHVKGEQFERVMREESARMAKVIQAARITMD